MSTRTFWAVMVVLCLSVVGILACEGNAANMAIQGIPKYICPSATPRPTDSLPPPNPPTYPPSFAANLDYSYVDPARSFVRLQFLAQNVGTVQVGVSGTTQTGSAWLGSSTTLASTGNYAGITSDYPVFIPTDVFNATINVSSNWGTQQFNVSRYTSIVSSVPVSPPCCLASPIYPTPQSTYTPYPTPTLFEMVAPTAFYAEDPVYNFTPPVQLRLRLHYPMTSGNFFIPLFTAAAWTIQITNVGTTEYDFLGAGYMYISEVEQLGQTVRGVWPPSHQAATFLGITEQAYSPKAVRPGETITVTVAAWIPMTFKPVKVALALNPHRDGEAGYATFTPGGIKVIEWVNQLNPICRGEIQYP
ncbi:MAG: hypothetical protein ABI947_04555 [Chloroflexota bacterium]